MRYGIATARRAWITAGDVLNTMTSGRAGGVAGAAETAAMVTASLRSVRARSGGGESIGAERLDWVARVPTGQQSGDDLAR